jgi:hypothetical protein
MSRSRYRDRCSILGLAMGGASYRIFFRLASGLGAQFIQYLDLVLVFRFSSHTSVYDVCGGVWCSG